MCENTGEVMSMQGNPYPIYQPMYGNPYAARQQSQQYYQPQPAAQPMTQTTTMVMVTSRKEAEAAQIVFDGLPHYFANPSEGEVYAKTYNYQTGKSDFAVYRLTDANQAAPAYVTADALAEVEAKLLKEIDQLTERLDRGRRARREESD